MSTATEPSWGNARLLAHYFRTNPRLAFRAFVVNNLRRVTICRALGHKHSERLGAPSQLLGLCDRCLEPHPRLLHLWRA